MIHEAHQKVTATHLQRNAYLYIRQSTIRQVFENTESTQRQYGLQQNAIALGWPQERIIVLDSDLGQSGASAIDRKGFQRLVAEVGMGRAGIVLGLEVSRLARNSTDWHRLLEICALTDTLILDKCDVVKNVEFTREEARSIGAEVPLLLHIFEPASESLQRRNEVGVMTPGSGFAVRVHERLRLRQGRTFCFQIKSQVLVSGVYAGVA